MINDDVFVKLSFKEDIDRIAAVNAAGLTVVDREGNSLLHEAAILNYRRHRLGKVIRRGKRAGAK